MFMKPDIAGNIFGIGGISLGMEDQEIPPLRETSPQLRNDLEMSPLIL